MAEALVSAPLSPETNESIFRNDILPDYLPETMRRVDRPRLILLGGQPGAGKTAVLIASHIELEQSGSTIRIVGDDLRSYHPRFLAFQRQDPETASQFTQGDAGRWTEKLLAAAAVRHVNIVFETTMRTPENVARVIGIARDAGYEVEARAVAVNPRSSWQGNHYRFEELLHLGAAARIPPLHIHDAAVDGLRVSLEKLESEHLVDRVQLRTRGGSVLYENEMRDGIARARSRLDRNMAVVERAATATAIVDASGEPFRTMREDLRLRMANLENRTQAKAIMVTVLDETARQRQLDPDQRRAADAFIRGITETERKLGGRRALDWDVVRTGALVPARHLPDLTESEIDDRLHDSSRLADKLAEIENLSRLVFGNGRAASAAAQGITDARSGYAAADNVREGKLADMAGEQETWFRAPSPERQTAEANAPRLAAALADYGLAVDFERHQIVTRHCEEQARQRVEIPPPSSVLAATLALGKDEKRRRFEGNADLRRELDRLSSAIDKRLTHANKADLKNESLVKLASDLGIGVGQARSLHQTSNLIARAQDNVRRLDRDQGRLTQLQIRR